MEYIFNQKLFQKILTDEIKAIGKTEGKTLAAIERELGKEIHKSPKTIEDWRTRMKLKSLPHPDDLANLAKALQKRGRLKDSLYQEFLNAGGHPNPKMIKRPRIDGPERIEYFRGREAEINALLAALQNKQTVMLCGPRGVGKTALVAELIQKFASDNESQEFPDGILYYDFRGPYSVDDACRYIAGFYSIEVSEKTSLRDVAYEALRDREALLILDSSEEANDWRIFLTIRGKCKLLIITCQSQSNAIELDVLPPEQAIEILKFWSTANYDQNEFPIWNKNPDVDYAIATEICELSGRLPLALYFAGNYMIQAKVSAPELLNLLREKPLSVLSEEGNYQHPSIVILLKTILKKVSKDARKVLAIIGLLAYDLFEAEVLAYGLGVRQELVGLPLGQLVKFKLVKRHSDGRYLVFHRLIHIYAQQYMPSPNESLERLTVYYAMLAENQSRRGLEGITRLNNERLHMMAILDANVKRMKWESVLHITPSLIGPLAILNYLMEELHVLEAGLAAAQALKDRPEEAIWLNVLGHLCNHLHLPEQALSYYEQALAIACETKDRHLEGTILSGIGHVYVSQHEFKIAIDYLIKAFATMRDTADRHMQLRILLDIGLLSSSLGEFHQTIAYYQTALEMIYETNTDHLEQPLLDALASSHMAIGETKQAIAYFERAMAITKKTGNHFNESARLFGVGLAYAQLEQLEHAIKYYHQALDSAKETGDRQIEGDCLLLLGNAYWSLGQEKKFVEFLEQAIAASEETRDHARKAFCLLRLGDYYTNLGQSDEAMEAYQKASELGPQNFVVQNYLGFIYLNLENLSRAAYHYRQQIKFYPINSFDAYINLGIIAKYKGWQDLAKGYFEIALSPKVWECVSMNSMDTPASKLENRALALLCLGQENDAILCMQEAIAQRKPNEYFNSIRYLLLAAAPNPPSALDKLWDLVERIVVAYYKAP